jgi:hypothetical protein
MSGLPSTLLLGKTALAFPRTALFSFSAEAVMTQASRIGM